MKKLTTICLCLLLVAAMAVTTFAAEGATFKAESSAESLYRGDTVTLTVSVNCDQEATSYGLMLSYDTEIFELAEGTCSVADTLVSSFNNGFAFMFRNPTAYSGTVGTVTLKVKDTAAFGTAKIVCEPSVKNGSESVAATGCTVSVEITCNHSYGAWAEEGTGHTQTCSVCGDAKNADHKWNDGTVTKEATCTEEGTTLYTCVDCGATKEEAVAMIDHSYGRWENADEENHKQVCSVCGKEETEAHAYGETPESDENSHWYACVCGQKKDEAAHTFDETVWANNEDSHWHTCECGAKSGEVAHAWDEGKVTVEATENNEGEKTYTCGDCGATKTEVLPKVPGNPQTGDEVMILPIIVMVLATATVAVPVIAKKKAD